MSCHTTKRSWAWVSPTLRAQCSAATPLLEASAAVRSTTAQVGHNSATYSLQACKWAVPFEQALLNMLSLRWMQKSTMLLCVSGMACPVES
jgi:hypothetical protein